jgi:hypothetical protein
MLPDLINDVGTHLYCQIQPIINILHDKASVVAADGSVVVLDGGWQVDDTEAGHCPGGSLATRIVVDCATSRVVNPSTSHVVLYISLKVAALSLGTGSLGAVNTIGVDTGSKRTGRHQ